MIKSSKKLSLAEQDFVRLKINILISELQKGNKRSMYRTKGLKFPNNINRNKSSLYLFKASPDFMVVLSLDDDRINNQKILTLFDIRHHNKINVCFMAIATKLYDNGK